MSFQPPKKNVAKKSFAVPKRSADGSGDGPSKESPALKKKVQSSSKTTNVGPPDEEKIKKEKKVKEKKLNKEPGSEHDEKKKAKKRKVKSENDENANPSKPKEKKLKKKIKESKDEGKPTEDKTKETDKDETKSKNDMKKNLEPKSDKETKDKESDTGGMPEECPNEIEDHFEALLNDIEDLKDEVEKNEGEEEADENGVVLDIDLEALPDDIRMEVLKQTNEVTPAAAWRSSQEKDRETPVKSKKHKGLPSKILPRKLVFVGKAEMNNSEGKDLSEKTKKKKKKKSKSDSHDGESCGAATGDENVDVFAPLESQEEMQDEVFEEKTEKKVKKKRKNKKPKKITEETECIEDDLSGLGQDTDMVEEGVKSLSPLEQLEADLLKAELEEEKGTWVQCENRWCKKWRLLEDVDDPSELPNKWTCDMNKDEHFNDCSIPEQTWDKENEDNFVYAEFTEGSIVWAKMVGFPWWPAMVQNDPDVRTFYEADDLNPMMPLYYHVVFLDKKKSRAWVRKNSMKALNCAQEKELVAFPFMAKGQSHKKQRDFALQQAVSANGLTLEEKLKKFGFSKKKFSKVQHAQEFASQNSMSEDDDFDVPKPKDRSRSKKRKVEKVKGADDVKHVSKDRKADLKTKVKKDKSKDRVVGKDGKKIKKKKTRNDVEKPVKGLLDIPKVDFRFRSHSQKTNSQKSNVDKNGCENDNGDENEGDLGLDEEVVDDHDDDNECDFNEVPIGGNPEIKDCSGNPESKDCDENVAEIDKVTDKGIEECAKDYAEGVEKTQEYEMEVPKVKDSSENENKYLKKAKKGKVEKVTKKKKGESAIDGEGEKKEECQKKKKKSDGAKKEKKKTVSEEGVEGDDGNETKLQKPKKKKKAVVEGKEGEKKPVKSKTKKETGEGKSKKVKKIKGDEATKDATQGDCEEKAKKVKNEDKIDNSNDDDDVMNEDRKTDDSVMNQEKDDKTGDIVMCQGKSDTTAIDKTPEAEGSKDENNLKDHQLANTEEQGTMDCEKTLIDEGPNDENTLDGCPKDQQVALPEQGTNESSPDDKQIAATGERCPAEEKPKKKKKVGEDVGKGRKKKAVNEGSGGASAEEKPKKKKKVEGEDVGKGKKKAVGEGSETKKPRKKRVKSESETDEKQMKKKPKRKVNTAEVEAVGKMDNVKQESSESTDKMLVKSEVSPNDASEDRCNAEANDPNNCVKNNSVNESKGSPCSSKPKAHSSQSEESVKKSEKNIEKVDIHHSPGKSSQKSSPTVKAMNKKVAGPMDRFLVKQKSKFVAPVVGKDAPKAKFVAPVVSNSSDVIKNDGEVCKKVKSDTPKKASKLSLKKLKAKEANSQEESLVKVTAKTSVKDQCVMENDSQELNLEVEAPKQSAHSQGKPADDTTSQADKKPLSPLIESNAETGMDFDKPGSQAFERQEQERCDSPGFELADDEAGSQAMDFKPSSPAFSVEGDESEGMDFDDESQQKLVDLETTTNSQQIVNES